MAEIPLIGGKLAIVDDEDLPLVAQYRWHYSHGYARVTVAGRTIYMHRLILGLAEGQVADHVNGNGLDNRRGNLRRAMPWQNAGNQVRHGGSSQFKGVYRCGGKWRAKLGIAGRRVHLGYFVDETAAARAYDRAAAALFGEFARPNFEEA